MRRKPAAVVGTGVTLGRTEWVELPPFEVGEGGVVAQERRRSGR